MLVVKQRHRNRNRSITSVIFMLFLVVSSVLTQDIQHIYATAPSVTNKIETPKIEINASKSSLTPPVITSTGSPTASTQSTTQVNEQFSGTSLNPDLWQAMTYPTGYRNNEEEDYSPAQVQVSNGDLIITAQKDANGQWHSGEVDSLWSYKYGDFEVRMALSTVGPGVWPAAWIMGTTGQWPTNGEIDIMEDINGQQTVFGTLHGGGSNGLWALQGATYGVNVLQYHTYMLSKRPNDISWYVDGIKEAEWTNKDLPDGDVWPFENYKYFGLLNLAIGGNWPGPTTADTPSTIRMYVDYFTVKNAY